MNKCTNSVQIGSQTVGGGNFSIIAGPCSIESKDHFLTTAVAVKQAGATLLRGGMFKMRTNPNTFQGLGSEAFDLVKGIKEESGLSFISEVTDPRQISDLMTIVDAFQVGSRNMYNYTLLSELGRSQKPVLLKRGFSGLIDEWLNAAEYITKEDNPNVILCERGIRSFETKTRNTFDINAIAYLKQNCSYPIIADPSHGTGVRELVTPISLAAAAAGADGLMIEVHPSPENALSDGFQTLSFEEFEALMLKLKTLVPALGLKLDTLEPK